MSRIFPLLGLLGAGLALRPRGTAFDHVHERSYNRGYDEHVIEWSYHQRWRAEREAEQAQFAARRAAKEAAMAAKRERDKQWIEAAEAKRQRKRAKALAMAGKAGT